MNSQDVLFIAFVFILVGGLLFRWANHEFWVCPECGKHLPESSDRLFWDVDICPYCGAKMPEEITEPWKIQHKKDQDKE